MSQRSRLFKEWRLIDYGSYGRIYSAEYPLDGQTYAIKCIQTRKDRDILREVRTLATINHPNICRYYGSWIDTIIHEKFEHDNKYLKYNDHGIDDNRFTLATNEHPNVLCIQMKLYDMNLRERMNQLYSVYDVKKWMIDILCGIRELRCHGFIHSDLCPRNILVDENTNTTVLSDFGIVSEPIQSIYHPSKSMIHHDIFAAFVISIELTYRFRTNSERITKLQNAVTFIRNDNSKPKADYLLLINELSRQFPDLLSSDINRLVVV